MTEAQILVYLPQEIKDKLLQEADGYGLSLTAYIRLIINKRQPL